MGRMGEFPTRQQRYRSDWFGVQALACLIWKRRPNACTPKLPSLRQKRGGSSPGEGRPKGRGNAPRDRRTPVRH